MHRLTLTLIFTLILCPVIPAGANITFRHWNESDGLPSDQIRSFATLDDGRIAIRIPNGLIVFDGTDFKQHYIDRSRQYAIGYSQKNIYPTYKDREGNLWLKSPGFLSLYNPVGAKFIYNVDSVLNADYGIDCKIKDLYIDSGRDLWFVTADDRLLYSGGKGSTPVSLTRLDGEWERSYGPVIEISGDADQAAICTASGIIKSWDKKKRQFAGCDDTFKGLVTDPDKKFRTGRDKQGRYWAMYDNRLWTKRDGGDDWKLFLEIPGRSNFFTTMAADPKGNIWLGSSWSGLRIIDGETLEVTEYPSLPLESGRLLSNDIQDIHIDDNGGAWVGTLWQGIAYHHSKMNPFHTFHTGVASKGVPNESTRAFLEDKNGDILIATSFNGVVRYTPSTGTVRPERPDILPPGDVYMCLYRDKAGSLWVGTYNNGFIRVMPDGSARRYNYDASRPANISRFIFEDNKGQFWVSVNDSGIGRLDPATGAIEMLSARHPRIGSRTREFGIFQLNDDELCIFGEQGVMVYSPSQDEVFVSDSDGLPEDRFYVVCNSALNDTRGLTWFATDNGVVISDISKYGQPGYAPVHLTVSNSPLPSNYISSMVEDRFGQLWLTTAGGLARVITRPADNGDWSFDMTVYTYGDGLNAGRITENAAFISTAGDVYLGGYNGVSTFNPVDLSSLKESGRAPLVTAISIYGEPVNPGETVNGRVILDSSLLNGKTVRLKHDENFFTVGFSSLDFISGRQMHFKYRLKGYDPDWVEFDTGHRPQAVYTGVPPGRYEFEVLAAGIDGVWSEVPGTVTVVVEPPLWRTWWAYLLYVVAAAALAWWGVSLYAGHRRRRLHREAERRELLQREQLNQMKFQFFTNISHEFRTPLALIMTPLSHLLQNEPLADGLRQKLGGIYRNAENLLGQVNRLLDFRKLEMGGEKLNVSRCRVVQFVSYLISSFESVASSRHISLHFESRVPEDTDVYLDSHKLRHILTNLYSNAIKFTPEGGSITTVLSFADRDGAKCLQIEVKDTGIGISEKDLPSIFDRFYQVDNPKENPAGSGIGLHLVREYVHMHRGEITAASQPGKGTAFTFTIPLDLPGENVAGGNRPSSGDGTPVPAPGQDGRPRILVVEDNGEFRDFLSEYLSAQYDVLTAVDGMDGLEKAAEWHPDIIVSDLMMPRMDGFGMTTRLKGDIATCHIPVILLTARASDQSRIESYKSGADSYISKPFNYDVLNARISMLLADVRRRKKVFKDSREIEPSAVTITSLDEKMVQKALETVEANMDNASFSTVQLGEALGLSRSQLYRKFESVTGMSPADFIQRMRLKRAAQLLRDSRLNVSEIADMTGFNSVKYFNKHFKEEYNCTPTEYRSAQSK